MADAPITAYTEVQIDDDSISLTLITESSDGVTIEDTERFTFKELQSLSGEHLSLSLSGDSREALSDMREDANIGRMLQSQDLSEKEKNLPSNPSSRELLAYMGLLDDRDDSGPDLPEAGDIVYDENPPDWARDKRVEVVEVLDDVRCDEYVIQGRHEGEALAIHMHTMDDKTVADANPSYDADEPVVIGTYADGSDTEYAFPAGRLSHPI